MTSKDENKMPYNVDMKVFDKIINELQHTKEDGISSDKLWINIGESKNLNKSYSLNMTKFLGLVELAGNNIKLTKFGRMVAINSENKRKVMLAKKLPDKYVAMSKWINMSPHYQMQSGDLKTKYVESFNDIHSPLLLERSVATFIKYLEHIGMATFSGKGKGAKATLTEFGREMLTSSSEEFSKKDENEPKQLTYNHKYHDEKNGHLITINTPGRDEFSFDIKSESDWSVIDSFINSIKEDWKKEKPTEKVKSKKVDGVTEPS
ncbi:MAG: hypothetical protein ABIH55_01635 [Nanoarchaeota archaeon]